MKTIALIGCCSRKQKLECPAKDLYTGGEYKAAWVSINAETIPYDGIYILSALHGLLPLTRMTAPYNEKMSKIDRGIWATNVLAQLREVTDLDNDRFIFFAGKRYYENLITAMKNYTIVAKGVRGIGTRINIVKKFTKECKI